MLGPSAKHHKYKPGDIVVFKNISWEHEDLGGFYSDHLHVVTKAQPLAHYYEIEETQCPHSNRKSWGSDGSDIRLAKAEEISKKSRLPKTIYCTARNPEGYVVFNNNKDHEGLFRIVHYTANNSLLIADKQGNEIEVEIFDIREATEEEMELELMGSEA